MKSLIRDALRKLVPFVQFKKREKHPWRSVICSKACNLTKSNTPPLVFLMFFKLYKWYQIAQNITYFSTFSMYFFTFVIMFLIIKNSNIMNKTIFLISFFFNLGCFYSAHPCSISFRSLPSSMTRWGTINKRLWWFTQGKKAKSEIKTNSVHFNCLDNMSDKKLYYQCFISSKYLFKGKTAVEGDYKVIVTLTIINMMLTLN